jgi:hypothetical protein
MLGSVLKQLSLLTGIEGVIKGKVQITRLGLVNQQKLEILLVGRLNDSGASEQTPILFLTFLKVSTGFIVGQDIAGQVQKTDGDQTSEAH